MAEKLIQILKEKFLTATERCPYVFEFKHRTNNLEPFMIENKDVKEFLMLEYVRMRLVTGYGFKIKRFRFV
uniref:Uncharacterized protein n=1 Tax=Ditylenchus dipsaci TaxID=166011 RepID=A0A915E3G9_9BILA